MTIRNILYSIFGVFFIFNSQISAETASSSKQEQWVQMIAETDTWTDGLGMPLDPGIKEKEMERFTAFLKQRFFQEG